MAKNTISNRILLAKIVTASMTLKGLQDAFQETLIDDYEETLDCFNDDWEAYMVTEKSDG